MVMAMARMLIERHRRCMSNLESGQFERAQQLNAAKFTLIKLGLE